MNVIFNFEGKNFVIVGASSGIGRQCALELAESGANILAIGRNLERLDTLQKASPKTIFTASLDVTKTTADEWTATLENFKISCGKIDGGIYSAGITGLTPLNGFDEEFAHKIIDINFWGMINFVQIATRKNFSNPGSSFVLMSSVAAELSEKSMFAYSASKAALQAAAISFAKEIIRNGHRINTVAPALVETELIYNSHYSEQEREKIVSKHLLGTCQPEDVAGMILFLLSDRAKKITGQNFYVDGGYLAGALI